MPRRNWRPVALTLLVLGSTAVTANADDKRSPFEAIVAKEGEPTNPRKATQPKALGESVKKGLKYLVAQQHENGGFGQGGGWRTSNEGRNGRVEGRDVKDPPDVGNTCVAALAMIRAGNTPKEGIYAKQLAKAVAFIETHVEDADTESLYVTPVRDTQLQKKIGQYVDTFLTALVLSELKGQMPDKLAEDRLFAALNKTIGKIESHQQTDGTFAGNAGWAGVLSQGICSKAVNRAYQKGVRVKTETIKKDFDQSVAQLDRKGADVAGSLPSPTALPASTSGSGPAFGGGGFSSRAVSSMAGKADAGVSLYSLSANAGRVQDAVNSNKRKGDEAKAVLGSPTADKASKERAQQELKEIAESEVANRDALKQIAENISDDRFLRGFGNNGGEEFLSYMNISETLFAQGGKDWEKWDHHVCGMISKVQNDDGSWSGHHCITGRTFCTSTALLTMMADRAPLPMTETKSEAKSEAK